MHVVMFGDQHLESLGGAQVSMRLQRRFLEKAGHTVTIVAPRMHGPRAAARAGRTPAYLDMPVHPDHARPRVLVHLAGPAHRPMGRRRDEDRPPVDVVHVQADFWGAFIGHRFAARHGLPVVHTMHNRVDVGIEATAPFPGSCCGCSTRGSGGRSAGSEAAAARSRRLVVPAAVRGAIGCRHGAVVALRPSARSSTGSCRRRRLPARRRHLERHRRRRARRRARRGAGRARARARRGSCGSGG